MKFLKRTVLITALLGIFLLLTSCGDDKTVNTENSGAGQTGTTTTTTKTVATVATTPTTAKDSWVISQKAERIYGPGNYYRYKVTVKKDKPSDVLIIKDMVKMEDGDWWTGGGFAMQTPSEAIPNRSSYTDNHDGTYTYIDVAPHSDLHEYDRPYSEGFKYFFVLKDQYGNEKASEFFCYPDLPC